MSQAFELALLLTLKDAASGGLDRFAAKLREAGKDGEMFAKDLDTIRSNMNRDMAIGGVGLAGLKMLKDGVQVAADYQSVMTDLRATIAQTGKDGGTNFNQLAGDMKKAEVVAVDLGNALPGTTADFVSMMQVLKQNGLDTETIMNGAAKAVAHLAVANNALPKDVAADFAQFGNIFKLRPEDYVPAADVFSRIFTSTGQTSAELVEAAKYFQGRAGSSLGIGGLKDAKEMTRVFGLFGMKGLRGSQAGTMLTDFFSEYNKNKDKISELERTKGIKLDFFDASGKFAGMDTVFEQMKQFDKLSDEDRSQTLEHVFGLRGMSAANVFLDAGIDGWKKFNAEQDKTVSQEEKVRMKTETFNNQMEALGGTLTNLKVAIFEPMLPSLTAAGEQANVLVGKLQELAKAHPDIAKIVVSTAAIGSAMMVAYSGVKMLVSGVRLLQMASRFSRSEGLVASLTATSSSAKEAKTNVDGLTASVTNATSKTGGLKKNLFSLSNVFKVVLLMETIGFTWDQISGLRKTIDDWHTMNTGLDDNAQLAYKAYQQTPVEQKNPKSEARNVLSLLEGGNKEFTYALDPSKQSWTDYYARGIGKLVGKDTEFQLYKGKPTTTEIMQNPQYAARVAEVQKQPFKQQLVDHSFGDAYERVAAEIAAVKNLRQRAPALADPQVMSSFRKDVLPSMGLSDVKQQFVEQLLQSAFPESFSASMTGMFQKSADGLTQSFTALQQPIASLGEHFSSLQQPLGQTGELFSGLPPPIDRTTKSLTDMQGPANRLPAAFGNIWTSANSVSITLDGLSSKISSWQPPASPTTFGSQVFGGPTVGRTPSLVVPAHAVGGSVLSDGLIMAHRGNVITPAKTTRGLSGFSELMSLARSKPQQTDRVAIRGLTQATSIFERTQMPPAGPSITVNGQPLRSSTDAAPESIRSIFERPEPRQTDAAPESIRSIFERSEPRQSDAASAASTTASHTAVTINASFAPVINASGGGDAKSIESTLSRQFEEFKRTLDRVIAKKFENGRVRA